MKSGVSPQKLQKYRWQTPIWASICTPVSSPEPVNFFGAQSSLGGHNFRLGGHSPGMPPVAPGLKQYNFGDFPEFACKIAAIPKL